MFCLQLPSLELAAAIALEVLLLACMCMNVATFALHVANMCYTLCLVYQWDAQPDTRVGIQPATMPLMILASTAIDTIRANPETVIKTCMGYMPTDSALFWASETEDRTLLKQQRMAYEPLVRWARRDLGLDLPTTRKMIGKLQIPEETVQYARSILEKMDHFELACLQCSVMDSKSLLIGLAVMFRKLSLKEACAASRIEEDFQTEIWGIVEGGHDMDILNNRIGLASMDTFLTSYWGSEGSDRAMSKRLAYFLSKDAA
jgi:chaperone required for assembly of F1-ATPase